MECVYLVLDLDLLSVPRHTPEKVELICKRQGQCYTLAFQLLIKVIDSQPPLLSGSDCAKLALIDMKRSTPLSAPCIPNDENTAVRQFVSDYQGSRKSVESNLLSNITPGTFSYANERMKKEM